MTPLLLLLLVASSAWGTVFQDCGSVGLDVQLEVEGCEVPPCLLSRGETVDITFHFTSSADTASLTIDAKGNIGGIEVPWPGVDTNGCLYTTCPISQGATVDWTMPVDILPEYPKVSVVVTFQLVDSAGGIQACAILPATII